MKPLTSLCALLLFSPSFTMEITEENPIERATITIQLTKEEYENISPLPLTEAKTYEHKLQGLNGKEVDSSCIVRPYDQIRKQLRNKDVHEWTLVNYYENGTLFAFLENQEQEPQQLSLEVTYIRDNSDNIKGDSSS